MPPMRLLTLGVASLAILGGCKEDKAAVAAIQAQAMAADALGQATPASADVAAGLSSENKTFRDWAAVCDNVNNCTAYGPAADNQGYVLVKIAAGPAAKPIVTAGSWSLPGTENAIRLVIDGQAFNGRMEGQAADNPLLLIAQPSDQLLRSIANGTRAHLAAGDQSVPVTLAGAAAAFLWIDERQGRLGTTTALIRRGQQQASSVPAAPAAPRLPATASAAQNNLPTALARQVAALPAVRQCVADNASSPSSDDGMQVNRLGDNLLLWGVPCGAGAYNFAQIYALSANDGSNARLVSLPSPSGAQTTIINSSFDPDTRTLGAFNKGRGIGDCGDMSVWQWTGNAFALKSQYVMSDCLGVGMDYWPSTWTTAD